MRDTARVLETAAARTKHAEAGETFEVAWRISDERARLQLQLQCWKLHLRRRVQLNGLAQWPTTACSVECAHKKGGSGVTLIKAYGRPLGYAHVEF